MKEIENKLIPIYESDEGNKLVNARELHQFLVVKTKFSDWIKDRIQKYDFIENVDFTCISEKKEMQIGATILIEYILTLDTAKEISMVQNNEKGRQARRYFIEVEKRYKQGKINNLEKLKMEQLQLKFIMNRLKVSKASEIKMLRDFNTSMGLSTVYLPEHTDEKAGRSATELLKKFNIPMSVVKFNKLMLEHEFLQEDTNRQGFKKYKSLTDKGLKYGKNEVSTKGSSKETQPLYYEGSFIELVNILVPPKGSDIIAIETSGEQFVKFSRDYLDNLTTDEIIAVKEKRISKKEFISSPPDVKEIVLGFFDIVIKFSKLKTRTI